MSKKELEQAKIFEQIKTGVITRSEGAARLRISDRWLRKKIKRYLEEGGQGLVHGNRGKTSPRKWNQKEKAFSLDLLRADCAGFGPTFTAEKLQELHGIKVSYQTIRKAMKEAG